MTLTHFDAKGQAHMVDVAAKAATHRVAIARGQIHMLPATLALVVQGSAKKGDVLGIARIAGIQAAKKTSDLIPLCHPLALTRVALALTPNPNPPRVEVTATVETVGATGVGQICDVALQIRGDAGERQLQRNQLGLAQNLGGSGATVVVTVLGAA